MTDQEPEKEAPGVTPVQEYLDFLETEQLDAARIVVRDTIVNQTKGLARGAHEDFLEYGAVLAEAAVSAARAKDDVSLASLKRSVSMLAEKHRLRAQSTSWKTFERVVRVVIDTAAAVLMSTLINPKAGA